MKVLKLVSAKPVFALAAALALAAFASNFEGSAMAQTPENLAGHWRQTTIEFEAPKDEHLLLNADGTVQNWTVRADSQTPPAGGTWEADSVSITLHIEGGGDVLVPYTFFESSLVLPNIEGQRAFWEKIAD